MATTSRNSQSDRERLEAAINAVEAQRAILGDEATDAAIASLRKELADFRDVKPVPGRRKEGQRRVVTILFSDVVGSTAMAERMDPEEWTEIMNSAFERLIEPIERYGGTIARLMGDAILAFFGAPVAHEDDPQRAVLAGLAILENFEPFQRELRNERGLEFGVRVGINTGLTVVGDVGSEIAAEYTAMGDAVNLAARMEQTAAPGTVQIAEDTYRLVAPLFDIEPLGLIEVKGKTAGVQSYKVLGRKVHPGRTRGIEGLKAPLVGRQQEIAVMTDLLSAMNVDSKGSIICLTGEAGLGKSRLLRELRNASNGESQWFETACLSYERNQPYSLIKRLIRRMIGVKPGDSPGQLRDRLTRVAMSFPTDEREDVIRLLAALFGLSDRSDQPPIEGEAFQKRLYTNITTVFDGYLRKGPTILIYDDLHWVDPASAALIQHLMPLVEKWPLCFVLSMRPDPDTYGWEIRKAAEDLYSGFTKSILLRPLSEAEGSQLVDSLLAIADLPQQVRNLILEKTEGNPFFVEEVVRSLIDKGLIVREEKTDHWKASRNVEGITIPDNVHSLLAARIDRLEDAARTTLQMASVVGRSFYYRVLDRIVDRVDDLSAELSELQNIQFIEEESRQPELSYIFRHALTQEAAYNAILLRQRRIYHRRVGETLEKLFPDQKEEFAGSLAYHFFQSHDYQRAMEYYTLAGDVAYRLYAFVEAIEHYSQAIVCIDKVDEVNSERLVKLFIRRGRALKLQNQPEEAMKNYHRLMELAEEKNDKSLKLASLSAQTTLLGSGFLQNDPVRAKKMGAEALSLARELGDRAAEARALWGMLLAEKWGGDPNLALDYGQQSLEIARELKLTQQIGYTLHSMAELYMFKEDFLKAKQANIWEREAWLSVGNTPMLADSYLMTSGLSLYTGDYSTAIEDAEAALRISRSIGNMQTQSVAPFYIGLALFDQGNIGKAFLNINRGVKIAKSEALTVFEMSGYSHLILLYCSIGAYTLADPLADRVYENRDQLPYGFYTMIMNRVAQNKLANDLLDQAQAVYLESSKAMNLDEAPLWFMAEVLITNARIQLALGNPNDALKIIRKLKVRNQRASMKNQAPWICLVEGNSLIALGEIESASEVFREGVLIAEEIGQRRLLWQLLIGLNKVEEILQRHDTAEIARSRAGEEINYISEHIGDRELRKIFLANPDVQSMVSPPA